MTVKVDRPEQNTSSRVWEIIEQLGVVGLGRTTQVFSGVVSILV